MIVEDKLWAKVLKLLEGTLVLSVFEPLGQLLIRLPKFIATVSIRAVFAIVTLFCLLEILTHLCLIIVVRDVHHLVLEFDR